MYPDVFSSLKKNDQTSCHKNTNFQIFFLHKNQRYGCQIYPSVYRKENVQFTITKPVFNIFCKINYRIFTCDKLINIFNIYIHGFAYMNKFRKMFYKKWRDATTRTDVMPQSVRLALNVGHFVRNTREQKWNQFVVERVAVAQIQQPRSDDVRYGWPHGRRCVEKTLS